MALGGGVFATQNKTLPGAYINFMSAKTSKNTMSERGVVAIAIPMDWGADDTIIEITQTNFQRNSLTVLGYASDNIKLMPIREALKNASKVFLYKLAKSAVKAKNTFAEATCTGVRGNDLTTVIRKNVNDETKFDVLLHLDGVLIDSQTVATSSELVDNAFVTYDKASTLAVNVGLALTGGTNGTAASALEYQAFLSKIESQAFNVLACASEVTEIKDLVVAYTKRMRDEIGVKFQSVLYQSAANYEGVISVANDANLVYWTAGAVAGAEVNESLTNRIYDGELVFGTEYTQTQLSDALATGKFIFHKHGNTIRVLDDINTLTEFTAEKSSDFRFNQTVRVLDQIGNDTALIFNDSYLGKVPNDEAGRTSLWSDVVSQLQAFQALRAIEAFDAELVTVSEGATKRSVAVSFVVTPINAMTQLYMTVIVA